MHKFFQTLWLFLLIILLILVTFTYYFAGQHVLIDFIALIPQWLFVFPLILLFTTLWPVYNQIKTRLLVAIILLLTTIIWLRNLDLVWSNHPQFTDKSFQIMSWNTAQWDSSRRDEFIAVLKTHPSDIFLLQEVEFKRNRELHGEMLKNFPDYQAGHYGEFFTLSKFPLNCNTPERSGGFLACTAQTPQGAIELVNVHLKRPFYITNLNTFEDFEIRNTQFKALEDYLNSLSTTVLIAGDFNSTANYPFIQKLSARYNQNNPIGNFLFPQTFPAHFPYMRIDYQFVSQPFDFCGYEILKEVKLSDHEAILGKICIP